jgi:hypothetical protein
MLEEKVFIARHSGAQLFLGADLLQRRSHAGSESRIVRLGGKARLLAASYNVSERTFVHRAESLN